MSLFNCSTTRDYPRLSCERFSIPSRSKAFALTDTAQRTLDATCSSASGCWSRDPIPTTTRAPSCKWPIVSPNSPRHLVVRKGRWVYIPARDEGGFRQKNVGDHCFGGAAVFPFTGQANSDFVDGRLKNGAPPAQLYDLEKDPRQAANVHGEHPRVVAELAAILQSYRERIGPGKPVGWIDRR